VGNNRELRSMIRMPIKIRDTETLFRRLKTVL